jgi:deoxyribodipyrimidine photo-lyase
MNVLIWFKRDLRVHDHPALSLGAQMGRVMPLYVVEPDYWHLPDTSARQWDFVAESLADLRSNLSALGAPLIIRTGDATTLFDSLCKKHHIARIISHEETGNAWTFARDKAVAAWAKAAGVDWLELPQSGVVRRLGTRNAWSGLRNQFMKAEQIAAPHALLPVEGLEPGFIPNSKSLKLIEDRCPHRQRGGRENALLLHASFLEARGEPYRTAMSSPLTAERSCSRLSAHLALGTVTIRQVSQTTQLRQGQRPGGRWGGALSSFQSRLAWRDHFIQKLEDQPSIEVGNLDPRANALARNTDAERLRAWCAGETGLPFVDACMRYLQSTGWLNFRMRAMVMATASYQLGLDWRLTGLHLARSFTDYEPGIHWPQVQMQSGTTGMNTPRIYNPIKQGYEHDPAGVFVRRWVPELNGVPDAFTHEPWRWPGFHALAGRRYPVPIVDPAQAQRDARDAIWALRRSADHKDSVAVIINKHASRSAKRPVVKKQTAQLALDL